MEKDFEPPPAKRRKAEHLPADAFSGPATNVSAAPAAHTLDKPVYLGGNRRSKLPVPSDSDFQKIKNTDFRIFARKIKENINYIHVKEPTSARKSSLPDDLPTPLKHALRELGFSELFSHQLEVRRNISQNKDVIITTPTSSGKSIAFNVPVFESIFKNNHVSSALYLFPLNALASDQEEKIRKLNEKLPQDKRMRIMILSGQIKSEERQKMFAAGVPHIIITSPDILHYQLSRYKDPEWQNWRLFLDRLRILVLDEAHSNIGVFGTNVSNLIRRLYMVMNRIRPNSHSRLRFIIASATVGNPFDLGRRLMSRKGVHRLCWIKESGAASFERSTLCLAAESNPKLAVAKIISLIVDSSLNGIVFVNSIQSAYDLMQFMQQYGDKSPNGKPFEKASRSSRVYNASMDSAKKELVLSEFKKGTCRVVISTNALEAGIDFPDLGVCVIKGYPGSRMSFLQRIGRAGRGRPGLIIFVPSAKSGADFFFAEHPDMLTDQTKIENIAFNPNYPVLLKKHVLAAIFELGNVVKKSELVPFYEDIDIQAILDDLVAEGKLVCKNQALAEYCLPSGSQFQPLRDISMRGGDVTPQGGFISDGRSDGIYAVEHNATVVNMPGVAKTKITQAQLERMKVIEIVPLGQIMRVITGAIFKHQNRDNKIDSYEVQQLDMENRVAYLKKLDDRSPVARQIRLPIISSSVNKKDSPIMPAREKWFELSDFPRGRLHITFSWASVKEKIMGYESTKKEKETGENLSAQRGATSRHMYQEPISREYEAPVIRFSFNNEAKEYLDGRVKAIMPTLMHNPTEQKAIKLHPELQFQMDALSKMRGAFVVLHTFIHQLMSVAPMLILTSTKSDLQEHELLEDVVTGYIVDNAPGGNGASELLFERFEEFVQFSEDWASACGSCDQQKRSAWGCALCLYQSGGKCRHAESGLVAVCGAGLLKLRPLSAPSPKMVPTSPASKSSRAPESITVSQAQNLMAENPAAFSGWVDDDQDSIVDKDSSSSSSVPIQVSRAAAFQQQQQQRTITAAASKIAPAAAVAVNSVSAAQKITGAGKSAPSVPQFAPLRAGGFAQVPAPAQPQSMPPVVPPSSVIITATPPVVPSTPDVLNMTMRIVPAVPAGAEAAASSFSVPAAPHERPPLAPARRSGDKVPIYLEPERTDWNYIVYDE